MIRLPSNLSIRDVDQWLYETWFLGKPHGKWQPFMYVGSSEGLIEACPLDTACTTMIEITDAAVWWPVTGAINVFDDEDNFLGAIRVVREQARQYKRSFDFGQVTLEIPREYDIEQVDSYVGMSKRPGNVVRSLFNPKYFTLGEAVQMIDRGTAHRVALSRHLMVVGNRGKLLLYYGPTCVGRVEDERTVRVTGLGRKRIRRLESLMKGAGNVTFK